MCRRDHPTDSASTSFPAPVEKFGSWGQRPHGFKSNWCKVAIKMAIFASLLQQQRLPRLHLLGFCLVLQELHDLNTEIIHVHVSIKSCKFLAYGCLNL